MERVMNWWWVNVLGPIVLGVAIAYTLLNRRKLSPSERGSQREAAERVYRCDR